MHRPDERDTMLMLVRSFVVWYLRRHKATSESERYTVRCQTRPFVATSILLDCCGSCSFSLTCSLFECGMLCWKLFVANPLLETDPTTEVRRTRQSARRFMVETGSKDSVTRNR